MAPDIKWLLRFLVVSLGLAGLFIFAGGPTKQQEQDIFLYVDTNFRAQLNELFKGENAEDHPMEACEAFAGELDFELRLDAPDLRVIRTSATRVSPGKEPGRFTVTITVEYFPIGSISYECDIEYSRTNKSWRLERFDLIHSPRLAGTEAARLEREFWQAPEHAGLELKGVYLAGHLGIPTAVCGLIKPPPAPGQLESNWMKFAVTQEGGDLVLTQRFEASCLKGVLRTFAH